MRGSRVQAVVNELQGERIDIIPYTEDMGTFIVNALQPAEVTKVVIDEEDERIEKTRIASGVVDEVLEIEGVTLPMAVIFGENDIKTVEDVAGLVPDDLNGYTEYKDGERIHEDGMIEHMGLSNDEATNLIMQARVKAGWIDASALEEEEEVEVDEEGNTVITAENLLVGGFGLVLIKTF